MIRVIFIVFVIMFSSQSLSMINNVPETHDFTFEHANSKYAIGFQQGADFDMIALTRQVDGEWKLIELTQDVTERLTANPKNSIYRTPEQLFSTFINKANKAMPDKDGLPPYAVGKIKELILLIRDNLKYENGKVDRID